ncbi:piggyBac transposable element-derived protein 3-like isoform X1 [Cyprinodon tularosa]|uniref:piggyBac transposable element-derived protein 3-like isoform X1 n=1 Tax=Cyprinodon tularosa TaxID=77115 RepID=UPI0018E23712|nr:piggyBac transposable element-derived protein 3-like isoform X1 [Cyprinodon tularosa]
MDKDRMPAARRDPRYSVQDITEIVEDGESDVDIPFDDTDASDEESDIDCVDNENQEPSDCPANSDIELREHEPIMPRDRYHWQKKDFISPNTDFSGPPVTDHVTFLQTPLQYFQKFVSEDMIQALATSTNEYSVQKDARSVNTNTKEIQKMLGMYLRMGLAQMSGSRMYWETDTRCPLIADVMPRNRFQSLLTKLHFVNNLTASEIEKKDKLWKLRPWLESFRENCLQVVPEEHNSVDEMLIPFKGKFSSIKQYMPGKPHPWGFKVWVRAGISGMMHDFHVYQGGKKGIRVKSELGLSGDAVLKLASTLPKGQNYKIYANKYFTSVPLMVKLLEHGIHYVGKARQVRLPNCNLKDEKTLKKEGRGSFDHRVEGTHNICAVKWYDDRAVTLVSSFAGPEPVQEIQRWDKATKTYIDVERPYIVATYNKYMGGVELLDLLTAKYKFTLKSRRWYMYIFWHTITLAVVNAWLLYKRHCQALAMPKKEMLSMRKFQAQLASSLILMDTTLTTPKRGCPSSGSGSPDAAGSPLAARKRPSSDEGSPNCPSKKSCSHPPLDVRKDLTGHFPMKLKRGRCRHCSKGYTNTQCSKCDVRLCFSEDRNCFWDYHCK